MSCRNWGMDPFRSRTGPKLALKKRIVQGVLLYIKVSPVGVGFIHILPLALPVHSGPSPPFVILALFLLTQLRCGIDVSLNLCPAQHTKNDDVVTTNFKPFLANC